MAAVATTEPQNPLTAGLERLPVAPTTLVIFGATGDLARRKLLPALYNLALRNMLRAHPELTPGHEHGDDYRIDSDAEARIVSHPEFQGLTRR